MLCLLLAAIGLYANDTYFYMAGGQLVPVDFTFFNHGETVTLDTGFPFFCVGLQGSGEITDFRCWTNGVETSYVDYPIVKEWAHDTELENAYVRSITFPSQQITTTRITYKSSYGEEAPSFSIAKNLRQKICPCTPQRSFVLSVTLYMPFTAILSNLRI